MIVGILDEKEGNYPGNMLGFKLSVSGLRTSVVSATRAPLVSWRASTLLYQLLLTTSDLAQPRMSILLVSCNLERIR